MLEKNGTYNNIEEQLIRSVPKAIGFGIINPRSENIVILIHYN